ncbi:aldo/keto reductase [Galbitalea sp. SE-J8]|uniref:aldo/keto reductase n=1 Tax=Galbitalea sp. SE-J8 TaxID=3054952 RepID=UPI00259CC3BC|nr:aldo/keto reductase [Galbitalea sp. SE-J8]MDM4762089.1 aldo/keto reductase [Galbitalea sp. SE-J8]
METRSSERLDAQLSVIGLGTWQLGADWGAVSERDADAVLDAAVESGVTLFDTADVYGDGRSERIIGNYLARHRDAGVTVATKMGRRGPQEPDEFTLENFRAWIDRSRDNLLTDTLDLVQLHCPPTIVFDRDQVYDDLDTLVDEGVIAAYGVSVETVDEALTAIEMPNVASVQIIVNAFRLKPVSAVLPVAAREGVAVLARVPLASGLLSGRYGLDTVFAPDDHRSYNRDGSAFDVGETFSGVDYATGVEAAREFAALAREHELEPATAALAWLVQLEGLTSAIPGARTPEQARANATAASVGPLPGSFTLGVRDIYDRLLRAAVHGRW